jgi:hypothetical protein
MYQIFFFDGGKYRIAEQLQNNGHVHMYICIFKFYSTKSFKTCFTHLEIQRKTEQLTKVTVLSLRGILG